MIQMMQLSSQELLAPNCRPLLRVYHLVRSYSTTSPLVSPLRLSSYSTHSTGTYHSAQDVSVGMRLAYRTR